ncbi:MAG: hypothetical protein A2Y74_03985 [Actinobacteria bacterium RBG_13_63_9]|nr:MAG: hypothetical protein A2Y74_03985 [Actinobacteria bacterium RBG_13_63_9]
MAPLILAIAAGLSVSVLTLLAAPASPAGAEAAPLAVSVDRSLSLVNQPVTVTITGQTSQSLNGAKLVPILKGPVEVAQVGQTAVDAPPVAQFTRVLGTVAVAADPGASSTTTTPPGSSTSAELAAGVLKATVTIPSGTPSAPGAYLLTVEVQSGGAVVASGQVWVGKASARVTPLDVSFVLPVSLGIHRDPTGAFFDRVLEEAVAPAETGSDSIRGLLALSDRFPEWNLTLAVEPILLTQLRDMADGYVYVDSAGNQVDVGENDLTTQNASMALAELSDLVAHESVEIVVSPYTGADLGILAAEGWRDGLEQIQMGKQELQRTLELEAPLIGAYSPDLDLTGESLAYYADASIDHVVVDAELKASLGEDVGPGAVVARVQNTENDRITLIFASGEVSAVVTEPWDVNVFSAAFAAELAASGKDALVVAPASLSGLAPLSYLESLGELLTGTDWIATKPLQELVRAHSLGTRPILFKTAPGKPQGYIESALLVGLKSAHAAVTDLAAVADTTRTPVDAAHRLLYMAESGWWSRSGASPQQASIGLAFAAQAQAVAQGELGKVRFLGADSSLIAGGDGALELTVENAAEYPMTVVLQLSGDGVAFPDGERLQIELQPGRTEFTIGVVRGDGAHSFCASLMAGARVLDEISHSMRFLGLMSILPWLIVVAGLVVVGGAYLTTRWYLRKRRAAAVD